MGVIVVDSSFLVPALVDEEHSSFVSKVLFGRLEDALIAPSLLPLEIASVLQKKWRQGKITLPQRAAIVEGLLGLGLELQPASGWEDLAVLTLCDRHGLTPYDGAYLLLAIEEGAAVASLDKDLARAARAEGLSVHCPF